MSQNNSIDFSNFNSINEKENFIKDVIKNNLIYRKYSVFYPSSELVRQHLQFMDGIYNSSFYNVIFFVIKVNEFAEIFAGILSDELDNILLN